MRYRSFTSHRDFSRDVATFMSFMDGAEYGRLLHRLGKGLNHKGFVTPLDDLRFSLELELLNLELLRRSVGGNFSGYPDRLHEAAEFIMSLGEGDPASIASCQKEVARADYWRSQDQRLATASARDAYRGSAV